MELTHSFTVPVGADETFKILRDIERVAPCMPGATVDSVDGDEFTGRVKVKVGPMQITYRGTARYAEVDTEQHRAVIEARGQETRGSGTANATITASLHEKGDETEVTVVSSLQVTGRPAQFGRGVMNDVGGKLLGQFADCLAGRLSGAEEAPAAEEATQPVAVPTTNGAGAAASEREITQEAGAAPPQPASAAELAAAAPAPRTDAPAEATQPAARRGSAPAEEGEAIDLIEVAGASVAKRLIPALIAVVALVLLWRRLRSS